MTDPAQDIENPSDLPYAYGGPAGHGSFRSVFEDFVVEETLGFEPSGEGEHLFLKIKKRGYNTEDVAINLAKFARVRRPEVSFAGLKDKHAVALQWFSIRLPKIADQDWHLWGDDRLEIVAKHRHIRKLKRGAVASNRFQIRICNLRGCFEKIEALLTQISDTGVPNYFGPQRFGRGGRNVSNAQQYFAGELPVKGRHRRGLLLSAARSFVFNRVLAYRVDGNIWNRAICGDALMFEGSKAYFNTITLADADILRISAGELHPTGVLWGKGGSDTGVNALQLENRIAQNYPLLCGGLERFGVEASRRSLRLFARELSWCFEGNNSLLLEFVLPAGGYATSVIREVLNSAE